MIKLVIFDLDGVLVDIKDIHFHALNLALGELDPLFVISREEHLSTYDGLKTQDKLKLLTQNKGLPEGSYAQLWDRKQELTQQYLSEITPNSQLTELVSSLKKDNVLVACCSNSIRPTVIEVLRRLEVIDYFDDIISNEDVTSPKPHPEIYWACMTNAGVLPEETVIIEDSPVGLLAAHRSGANVVRVRNSKELSVEFMDVKLKGILNLDRKNRWEDKTMNVLIPMAGLGTRFQQAGYTFPKPLIEVNGKPMIQIVVENLGVDANYIFVVQKEHREKYNLDSMLQLIAPGCKIYEVESVTEGAACTTLIARESIDNDQPLLMANSDQFVEWNPSDFFYKMNEQECDAGIVTFKATHPKWSFARVDETGRVTEVAEKNPISDNATVGIYYWAHGSDYVRYADQMISKNIRVKNEFYVCPVFNEAIVDNKLVKIYQAAGMWGLGTPEDLETFLGRNV